MAAGWLVPDRLPASRIDAAPAELCGQLLDWESEQADRGELLLVNRRLPRQINTALCDLPQSHRPPFPTLLVHPSDAARLSLSDGGRALVSSAHGRTTARVEVDDGIRAGAVSLTHGRADGNVNELTSSHVAVEPLTGMPRLSGVAVTVEPVLDAE
jgi:anaerobic selenocysteine-containing dehydrogenase